MAAPGEAWVNLFGVSEDGAIDTESGISWSGRMSISVWECSSHVIKLAVSPHSFLNVRENHTQCFAYESGYRAGAACTGVIRSPEPYCGYFLQTCIHKRCTPEPWIPKHLMSLDSFLVVCVSGCRFAAVP